MPTLHIAARQPIWQTNAQYYQSLTGKADSYSHELQAFGGFWKADFGLSVSEVELNDWLANGLGRDIIVKSPGLTVIFEGFVNRLTAEIGTMSLEVGPLLGIANRVSAAFASYSPIGGSGIQLLTDEVNDLDSQALYGILCAVISASQTTITEAEHLRDIYLLENAWPQMTQSIATGKQGESSRMSVEVLGYIHFLETYPYNDLTDPTAYVNLSTKLASIIAGSPSSIFSTNTANIATNSTIQVPSFERDDAIAMELVKGLVERGNGAGARATFGIYEDREPYYEVSPTDIAYEHSVRENRQAFYHYGTNNPIFKGLIRPGKFVHLRDVPLRGPKVANMRSEDIFIERVSYNGDDDSVQITSSRVSTFDQIMDSYGV